MKCSICAGSTFEEHEILWPDLITAWGLSEAETRYINHQQGRSCTKCGASLRIVALGNAIRHVFRIDSPLQEFCNNPEVAKIRILDINGAAALSPALAELGGYTRGDFPTVDMEALPYPSGTFDLVIHSDTLEHVPHPIRGLEECRRVLAPGGRLCFTIPVIVERLTRSRAGLAKSWHRNAHNLTDDFLVHTEFGSDAWTYVMRAGFTALTIHQVAYPAATAISA